MSIIKSSVLLFVVMSFVLLTDATNRGNYQAKVSLFKLCDSNKDGYVTSADVSRVRDYKKYDPSFMKTLGSLDQLKKDIDSEGKVNSDKFENLRRRLHDIPEQVDLYKFFKDGKTHFTKAHVKDLLGIGENDVDTLFGDKQILQPSELWTYINEEAKKVGVYATVMSWIGRG